MKEIKNNERIGTSLGINMRTSRISRQTNETDIEISLNIDGTGKSNVDTGIGFLNHVLTLFSFHGGFDLIIKCKGDLNVDTHHTVEDIGIALGKVFNQATENKIGIKRYGSCYLAMDESLVRCVADISGRAYLVYNLDFNKEVIGTMDTENFKEFFRAFCFNFNITLHIELLYGENDHHKIEAVFKGLGRTLRQALEIVSNKLESTKGLL